MSTRTKSKNELAAEVGRAMMRITKAAKRSMRHELEQIGLTFPQALVMQQLAAAAGRLSARAIVRECDMLASTATGVIDRLEEHGYVRRERDRSDRRVVWVELTDRGKAIEEQLPRFATRIGSHFAVLTGRELEQLLAALGRVEAAIDEGDA
jgi:DNA-binding MarR family transcriptional regulator